MKSIGPISLLPLWSEANITARAIHGDRDGGRALPEPFMYRVKSFQNILVGVVIRPTSCCSVTLFLECYANAVFIGHEGGLEPPTGAPGWQASCPSHAGHTVRCSIWWHHHFYNERKYILKALWLCCYMAHGFLWVCLPAGGERWHIPTTSTLGPTSKRKSRLFQFLETVGNSISLTSWATFSLSGS